MTNFSTNQVMQFYVVPSYEEGAIKTYLDGSVVVNVGTEAEPRFTDKIENVMWGKLTSADALKKAYKEVSITLAGEVVPGENYVVRVSYPEVAGLGVEGWTTKTAVAHAKKDTTATDIYAEIAEALNKAFEADGVLEATGKGGIKVTAADVTKNYKKGLRPVSIPEFNVTVNTITVDGEEADWATVTEAKSERALSGTYKLSDMEYFAMGERGDQYRMAGFPDVIETEYKITDYTKEYDVLIVHFAYKGANEGDYKSEKDLVLVGTKGSLNSWAQGLSTATGVTFTKVTVEEGKTKEAVLSLN